MIKRCTSICFCSATLAHNEHPSCVACSLVASGLSERSSIIKDPQRRVCNLHSRGKTQHNFFFFPFFLVDLVWQRNVKVKALHFEKDWADAHWTVCIFGLLKIQSSKKDITVFFSLGLWPLKKECLTITVAVTGYDNYKLWFLLSAERAEI